jgi:hypothetical protein
MRKNLVRWLTTFAVLVEAVVVFAQVPAGASHLPAGDYSAARSFPTNASDLSRIVAAFTSNLIRWDLVKGLPFAATGRIVLDGTLGDGTTVSNSYEVSCWRDSRGRRRAEYVIQSPNSNRARRVVTVWDPVNRTILNWTSGDQTNYVVMLNHVPPTVKLQNAIGDPPPNHPSRANYQDVHTESLPPDMVARLHVEGVRSTWTIPDDNDITVTSETWSSPELKIIVRQITNDVRSGKVITDLTSVDRSDPDPTLFLAPETYTVRDLALQHLSF